MFEKKKTSDKKSDPFISLSRRNDVSFTKSVGIKIAAVILALVLGAILTIVLTKQNPFKVYSAVIEGNFGNSGLFRELLRDLAVLLCISLAITPAFRMKFWNVGAEGQVLAGSLATAITMLTLGGKVPEWLLMILMAFFAMLAGALWGVLPAIFKAKWETNETLFTLMMNYIAIQAVELFLKIADRSGSNTVGPDILTHGWFPDIFGVKYLSVYLFAIVMTAGVYLYLNYSKHGYEISVVGESRNTAKYIGINVHKVIIRTMTLSGALCGLVGLILTGVINHSIDSAIVGGNGFTAIMVSWLAHFNPIIMIPTSFIIVFLSRGASEVSTMCGLNSSFPDILTGLILLFIIGSEFFTSYKITFRSKKAKVGKQHENEKGCEVK